MHVLDENKAVMRRMVEMFATGNLSDVRAVIAARYIDHQGLSGSAVTGPDGFRHVVMTARSSYPNLRIEVKDLITEGDSVALRLRWYGMRQGKPMERETIDIVRFVKGQAVEHWGVGVLSLPSPAPIR
jgi:predicted SnoaL-like aldol condensation-catalyzing enzyme